MEGGNEVGGVREQNEAPQPIKIGNDEIQHIHDGGVHHHDWDVDKIEDKVKVCMYPGPGKVCL